MVGDEIGLTPDRVRAEREEPRARDHDLVRASGGALPRRARDPLQNLIWPKSRSGSDWIPPEASTIDSTMSARWRHGPRLLAASRTLRGGLVRAGSRGGGTSRSSSMVLQCGTTPSIAGRSAPSGNTTKVVGETKPVRPARASAVSPPRTDPGAHASPLCVTTTPRAIRKTRNCAHVVGRIPQDPSGVSGPAAGARGVSAGRDPPPPRRRAARGRRWTSGTVASA